MGRARGRSPKRIMLETLEPPRVSGAVGRWGRRPGAGLAAGTRAAPGRGDLADEAGREMARHRESAAFRPEGQADDLPVHGRRAVAPGDARLQARSSPRCTASRCRSRSPRGMPIAQLQGQKLNCFAPQHPFQKYGKSGRRSARSSPSRLGRRRDLHHPLDGHRGDQPRPGPHLHEHRHDISGRPGDGLVAHLRARQRERRTCRGSSC